MARFLKCIIGLVLFGGGFDQAGAHGCCLIDAHIQRLRHIRPVCLFGHTRQAYVIYPFGKRESPGHR